MARRVTAVGEEIEGVVEVVVHHREAFLVGGRSLAEVTVPASRPSGVVGIVVFVRPGRGPGPRVVADGGRASPVDRLIGLEIARTRLEPHHPLEARADALPLPVAGFHDVNRVPGGLDDVSQYEGGDAV